MSDPQKFRAPLAAALLVITLGGAAAAPRAADGIQVYTNPHYRWSVAYPANWMLDVKNDGYVRIVAPEKNGACGIRSRPVSQPTADAFADFALAYAKKNLKEHRSIDQVTVSRTQTKLRGEIAATEVVVSLKPGAGQARRIYTVVDGNGYMVNCAASNAAWPDNDRQFKKIIASFTPSR